MEAAGQSLRAKRQEAKKAERYPRVEVFAVRCHMPMKIKHIVTAAEAALAECVVYRIQLPE